MFTREAVYYCFLAWSVHTEELDKWFSRKLGCRKCSIPETKTSEHIYRICEMKVKRNLDSHVVHTSPGGNSVNYLE